MRILPGIFIYASFLVAELHNLFKGSAAMIKPSISGSDLMPIEWGVYYIGNEMVWAMNIVALYYMNTLKFNRNAANVLLSWVIIDVILFFLNFKTLGYGGTYLILAILIIWFNVDKGKFYNWIKGNEKRSNGRAIN